LLGIDIDNAEARIDAIRHDAWENHGAKGKLEEALAIIHSALKEFPNSYKLLLDKLVYYSLTTPSPKYGDDESTAAYHAALRECVEIGEKILEGCTDDHIMCEDGRFGKHLTWRLVDIHCILALTYMLNGNGAAALEQLSLAAQCIVSNAADYKKDGAVMTSLAFRGLELNMHDNTAELVKMILHYLEFALFDPVRDTAVFREVEATIKNLKEAFQ